MIDFWPACGWRHLDLSDQGRLVPTAAWWRHWLDRPELALVGESCAAEIKLHQALRAEPTRMVAPQELSAIGDADARDNYRHFLALRDGITAAGTLEAFYVGVFRQTPITLPPLFLDWVNQAILRQLLNSSDTGFEASAFEARSAEMLFRPQRISLEGGRVLAGDRATLDRLTDAGGFGALGRLLAEAKVPLRSAQLVVLASNNQTDNCADYWHDGERHRYLLDLTHTVAKTLAPGINAPITLAHSGLAALARVLARWVQHLLGVVVSITPVARIDDAHWRWFVGLDAEATLILNALYRSEPLAPDHLAHLVGLFRLDFEHPAEMRADLAGTPVYLGLAMDAAMVLRLKPQNLLLNLPLAQAC